MNELTIVTAFFDIGRKDFKEMPRTNEKYVEHFKFWARIQNKIVVYTDSVMAKRVKEIRKEFGLLNKTEVVIIDDISTIEPELLKRMEKVEKDLNFVNFRYNNHVTENNAKYNYVMLLKAWCIKDAVEKGLAKGQIAWLDFGFNHGGDVYINPSEFDFEWKYSFKDKVNFFAINKDDDAPIFKKVQSLEVNFMGFLFIVPDHFATHLWNLYKNAMNSLIDCGFIDDDQLIMLMAYRKDPKIFEIIESDWFLPLKQFGGEHLTIAAKTSKQSLKDKLLYKYRVRKRNKKCINRLKKLFEKDYLD